MTLSTKHYFEALHTLKKERRATGGGDSALLSWPRGHTPTKPGAPLPSGTYAARWMAPAF